MWGPMLSANTVNITACWQSCLLRIIFKCKQEWNDPMRLTCFLGSQFMVNFAWCPWVPGISYWSTELHRASTMETWKEFSLITMEGKFRIYASLRIRIVGFRAPFWDLIEKNASSKKPCMVTLDPVLPSHSPQSLCRPVDLAWEALDKCWWEWGFLVCFPVLEEDEAFLWILSLLHHPNPPVSVPLANRDPTKPIRTWSFALQGCMVHLCVVGAEEEPSPRPIWRVFLAPFSSPWGHGRESLKVPYSTSENPCSSPMVRLQTRKQKVKGPNWPGQATDLWLALPKSESPFLPHLAQGALKHPSQRLKYFLL